MDERIPPEPGGRLDDDFELESTTTSAADVESAGRSCLVIFVLLAAILVLLVVWVVYSTARGG